MKNIPLREEIDLCVHKSTQIIRTPMQTKIAELRKHLRVLDEHSLCRPREIPKNTQQVFDILLSIWSHEFPGRKFGVLCVQSGMPWTWTMSTICLWDNKYICHLTGRLQPPSLLQYPYQNIKTQLMWYDCHVVEITDKLYVGDRLCELEDFSRGKDVFLYGTNDLYNI